MKRILILVLALVLLLLPLASCGGKTGETTDNGATKSDESTAAPAETTTEKLVPDLPEKDYEGYEFRILGNSNKFNGHWYCRDIDADEISGETLNDAIYNRNAYVEEKYKVKITAVPSSANPYTDAKKSLSAGDNAHDLYSISMSVCAAPLAVEGSLIDLNSLQYLELDMPWWDQKARSMLSVEDRLYLTVNDSQIIDKDALFIWLFNKDVIKDAGLEDPYKLVAEGKWTIDKLYDMGKVVTKDLNGDGNMDDTDTYGIITQTHTMHGNVVSSGDMTITKDASDVPQITLDTPKILQTYDKWINIMNDRSNTMIAQDWTNKYTGETIWDMQLDVLAEKRGLFLYTGMNRVTMLRDMDCNFGILPNPKLDEKQTEYYNAVHAFCTTAICIPVTAPDPERTSIILEALTGESYYTLRPAYYDVLLKNKLMRDNESGEMLDLIFATRCYDLGHVFNWGTMFDMFGDLALKKSISLTAEIEKRMPKIKTALDKTIEQFREK